MTPTESAAGPLEDGEAASLLVAGFEEHQAGRPEAAALYYRRVLERNPAQRDALMLLGLLLAEGPEVAAAEALLLRYLDEVPGDPLALRHLGLLAQRRGDDVTALGRLVEACTAAPDHAPTWHACALSLQRLGRRAEARTMFEQAVALAPDLAAAWHDLGHFHEEDDALGLAEAAYRRAVAADPDCLRAYARLGAILDHTGRPDEADRFWTELARRRRVDHAPSTGPAPLARLLLVGGAGPCNIRPDFIIDRRFFETRQVNLLAETDAEQAALIRHPPPADLAFGLIADPDRGARFWPAARALMGGLTCPVLNPPDERILRTDRAQVAALLDGIPGLVVPRTRRLDRAALLALAAADGPLERPLLVRPCGSHVGGDLARIEQRPALAAYLERLGAAEFYLTDYHDYRSEDGLYRKYRFIFVDRRIYPYHLAISPHWMIHYFRAETPEQAWMRDEEARFLADPATGFPGDLAPVEAIARRLDLDYAGVDLGVLPDGRLLLFEANPSMLAHLQDPPELFAYKHAFVPRIRSAMTRMILGRLGLPVPPDA